VLMGQGGPTYGGGAEGEVVALFSRKDPRI
jgi:hypothetical protein